MSTLAQFYNRLLFDSPVPADQRNNEWRVYVDFVRAVKNGPACLLGNEAQLRLVHFGAEDAAFRAAFRLLDAMIVDRMAALVAAEMPDHTPGFLDGGSAEVQQQIRQKWLDRRAVVVADYIDLMDHWRADGA